MEKNSNVVILIPAYNPDKKMISLVKELAEKFEKIMIVNDGCSEEYNEIFDAVKEQAHILVHDKNCGKGRALKTGFEYIVKQEPDVIGVVTADADGQHTLTDISNCVDLFLKNPQKAIFGCRDFKSDTKIPPRSRFGNRLTSRLMKFFCDIVLSDTQTGLRVFSKDSLPGLLQVKGERYEYEMNCIFHLKDEHIEWEEMPIEVIYIDNNESSHFNPIVDSFRIYKVFLKFCISSFGSALLDLGIFSLLSYFLQDRSSAYYILIATVCARIISGIFNFSLNRWIFASKSKVTSSAPRYLILWFVQMMLSAFLVDGVVKYIWQSETPVKIIVDSILFFISYKIQQKWVFCKKNN